MRQWDTARPAANTNPNLTARRLPIAQRRRFQTETTACELTPISRLGTAYAAACHGSPTGSPVGPLMRTPARASVRKCIAQRLLTGSAGTQPWRSSKAGATPQQCRSIAVVASKLQASCKPVAGLLEASSFSLPPAPVAEHRRGPACERRSHPQGRGTTSNRLRIGSPGYRDSTDCEPACAAHSGPARSRDGCADESRPMQGLC